VGLVWVEVGSYILLDVGSGSSKLSRAKGLFENNISKLLNTCQSKLAEFILYAYLKALK
jgi:hypothetical protein